MKKKHAVTSDLETVMPLLIGVWRRMHKLAGPADVLQTREFRGVVAAIQTLQAGLETKRDLVGTDYFADPNLVGAYLLYQWVIHYQEGLSLIGELPFTPKRVLDLGSGPGAFAFAALKHGASEVIALDRSTRALNLASEVCGRYGFPLTIRTHDCRKVSLPVEGKFDLIIIGHCLSELFPENQPQWQQGQKTWIDQIQKYLNPDGFLLIVDSSQPSVNKRILSLRDQLVQSGLAVQAPCVWRGPCPALQSENPCYAQREFEKPYLIKEIQRAAQINLSSLKMSYLIMRAPQAQWPELPPRPFYRVISPPIDEEQGKRFYLCGTDGKKSLGSQLTEFPAESRAFEYLKRGELISIEDAVERSNRFEITLGTRVRIEAALGKKIPEIEKNEDL